MAKLVFHVDVNSAYLSWEAARRVANGEPDIRLIPSVIGGDREKRTGVVLAKSIPAKKFGIKTGEPIGMALRKCPDLFMAKPDFRLYEENSKKFMDICREYAPVVEKASIDECYLDMSGTHRIYPDPIALAYTIKDRIRDEFGFTVNVGIGDNKLLAKMASDFEKPDKIHTLFLSEIPKKMWPLPVGELFTVGGATADKLRQAKIMTIGDLAHTDLSRVQKIVGMKMGKHIHDYANGIDSSPVLAAPEEAKGYSISTTLEDDIKKSGLFWVANRAECPVKIMDDGDVAMIFLNGYVFARAVGMKEKHGNPMSSFIEEGAQIIVRASEFKKTETIIELCNAEDTPVVIRKYGYEYYIALAPKVYEQYRHLFESDNLEEDKL